MSQCRTEWVAAAISLEGMEAGRQPPFERRPLTAAKVLHPLKPKHVADGLLTRVAAKVPPRAPLEAVLAGLPAALSHLLRSAISEADLDAVEGVEAFARLVEAHVAQYTRHVYRA